jgi:hypothetical protein
MAQTAAYTMSQAVAVAGMLDGTGEGFEIETFIANEDLPFGRAVRLVSGGTDAVELPTDDTGTIVGFVVFKDMLPQLTTPPDGTPVVKAGTPVAILRKGRMWADWDGAGTPASLVQFNVRNNTAAPTTKGKVTAAATSANVVRAGLRGNWVKGKVVGTSLALVQVNLP